MRSSKVTNGTTTKYLYEYDKVVLELNETGEQIGRNIYGTNLLMRTAKEGAINTTYYYLYNGHGDVTALADINGSIAATYHYDEFGNIDSSASSGNVNNSITYAGYQYDKESGLYYLNARMYDPVTARFFIKDTYTGDINDPLSLNLYTYCHNEPLMYWDPTGHDYEYIITSSGIEIYDTLNKNKVVYKTPGPTLKSGLKKIVKGVGDALKSKVEGVVSSLPPVQAYNSIKALPQDIEEAKYEYEQIEYVWDLWSNDRDEFYEYFNKEYSPPAAVVGKATNIGKATNKGSEVVNKAVTYVKTADSDDWCYLGGRVGTEIALFVVGTKGTQYLSKASTVEKVVTTTKLEKYTPKKYTPKKNYQSKFTAKGMGGTNQFIRDNIKIFNTYDKNAFKTIINGDSKAFAIFENQGNKIIVDQIDRGALPKGSGGNFLAESFNQASINPANKQMVFKNIINTPSVQQYTQGVAAADTVVGKMGVNALSDMGLEAGSITYEVDSVGKLNIIFNNIVSK